MELIKKTLCDSYIDYQPLLSNLSLVKTIFITTGNCTLYEMSAALKILEELFYDPGQWYNPNTNPYFLQESALSRI